MAGRSGRRRVDPCSPVVDLDAVFADDALIDAIAAQSWTSDPGPFAGGSLSGSASGSPRGVLVAVNPLTVDPSTTVDPLTEILESWRQELAVAPLPAPPRALQTNVPVHQRRPQSRSRALRPALAIAAAIAALLVGSASVGSKDAPRDSPLFALTQVLWPSRVASVASADQVGAILVEARFALDNGRQQDAQLALLRAAAELGRVDDVDGKGEMQQKVATLWVEAAPLDLPGTRPRDEGQSKPTPTRTRSSGLQGSSSPATVAAQSAAAQSAAAQSAAAQSVPAQSVPAQAAAPAGTAGPQIDPSPTAAAQVSSAGILLAASGTGSPTGSAVAPSSIGGSVASAVDTPTASAAAISSVAPTAAAAAAPAVSSAPSTPPQPTVPADPPAELPLSDPPSATEQSPPSPTPSGSASSVLTMAPGGSGPLSVDTDVASSASNPPTKTQVPSILQDPAVVGSG